MKYLLDTSICIYLFRGNPTVCEHFKTVGLKRCRISEITKAEILAGLYLIPSLGERRISLTKSFLDSVEVVPISSCIDYYAKQKAKLQAEGNTIEDFDLLIGCTAVNEGLIMVTDNTDHFSRIDSITIENWKSV